MILLQVKVWYIMLISAEPVNNLLIAYSSVINRVLNMPHLSGEWVILVATLTDVHNFGPKI